MRRSRFFLLLAVTLLALVGALALLFAIPPGRSTGVEGSPAFPLLAEQPSAATAIAVTSAEGSYRVIRSSAPGLWLLPEAGGYPLEGGAAARLLSSLARLELFEAKTARPDLLDLLGLAGPDAGPQQGRRVLVTNAAGEPLVDAVIGAARTNLDGTGAVGTYLRYSGTDQAWLALGELQVPARVVGLLDSLLVALPGGVIAELAITPPEGGAPLRAARAERGALGLDLVPPPPDGMASDDFLLRQMADSFSRLAFRAVRPVEEIAFTAPWDVAATTFDGIRLRLTLQEIEGEVWARLAADAVAPLDADAGASPREDALVFAADLAGRVDGWVYRLDPLVLRRLAQRRQDLVEVVGE
ncbi:MAG: hypothetical protein Kilf2KO_29140 [Rhodospirillales bacterium]